MILNWKKGTVKIADVKMNPDNPRSISESSLEGLRQSLKRFGYVEPIVWNKTTGHIVGGHQRYYVLVEAGISEAKMMIVEMTLEEESAANLTLNNPEIEGTWSDEAADLLHQVESSDSALFNALNLNVLRDSLEGERPSSGGGEPVRGDTTCPCCKHMWNIKAEDVTVEG